MTNEELKNRDLEVLWHPCTQMKDYETLPLIPIEKAHGVYITDFEGNSYIDSISSWWVNIFGHTNKYINTKIKEQLDTLEHVIIAGFTHKSIIELSERLVKLTPSGLDKCFYADNGSSAVEVALKMSYHYNKNRGKEKSLFVSLQNSYHGETIGALSVGDVELYKDTYKPLLIRAISTPTPFDQTKESAIKAAIEYENLLKERASEISALIIEPLVQGAGYMNMYHPHFITLLSEISKKYDVHLIADEILVGFGRTGTMFACESAEITPDFMLLSKGLTGGYLPLSVCMTTNEIYSAFYCDYEDNKAFLHSHSYTGNALACAAANATIDIFENENIIEKNKVLIDQMQEGLLKFSKLNCVKETRQQGMIAAIELQNFDQGERIGVKIYQEALKYGVYIRPLGHVVYFMPPYVISKDELQKVIDVTFDAVVKVLETR